jgi:hypothetical protein
MPLRARARSHRDISGAAVSLLREDAQERGDADDRDSAVGAAPELLKGEQGEAGLFAEGPLGRASSARCCTGTQPAAARGDGGASTRPAAANSPPTPTPTIGAVRSACWRRADRTPHKEITRW